MIIFVIRLRTKAMVEVGQFIKVSFLADSEDVYFRTKEVTKKFGKTYYIFCKAKLISELTISDFWGVSEDYYNQLKDEGKLKEIEHFNEL